MPVNRIVDDRWDNNRLIYCSVIWSYGVQLSHDTIIRIPDKPLRVPLGALDAIRQPARGLCCTSYADAPDCLCAPLLSVCEVTACSHVISTTHWCRWIPLLPNSENPESARIPANANIIRRSHPQSQRLPPASGLGRAHCAVVHQAPFEYRSHACAWPRNARWRRPNRLQPE